MTAPFVHDPKAQTLLSGFGAGSQNLALPVDDIHGIEEAVVDITGVEGCPYASRPLPVEPTVTGSSEPPETVTPPPIENNLTPFSLGALVHPLLLALPARGFLIVRGILANMEAEQEFVVSLECTTERPEVIGGLDVGGWIYIADVTVPGGAEKDRVWQDAAETVLQAVTVTSLEIEVEVRASYPLVNIGGTPATLTRDAGGGFYSGTVPITLSADGAFQAQVTTPDNEDGPLDTCVTTLEAPPAITALNFTGPYPTGPGGLQTELAEGDSFDLAVTADKAFDLVEIQNSGASQFQSIGVTEGLSAIVQILAADRGDSAQQLPASVRVRDASTGAYSTIVATNAGGGSTDGIHVVTLNNLAPSGAIGSISYPGAQSAVKGSETADVPHTASDFDTILYSDPTGSQIAIPSPTAYATPKTVTCQVPGVFNNSSPNFRYVMTRNANGRQTTVQGVVVVADVAPTIDITLPAARLRSGGNHGTSPQDHEVTLTSNQPLLNAPTLNEDSGGDRGTFQGSWAGGSSVWTRDLRVDETVPDEKGTFSFEGLVATGLAGLVQNTINSGASYTLGGFVQRTVNFPAFTANCTETVVLVDETKLASGSFSNGNPGAPQLYGTSDTYDYGKEGWFAPTAASGSVNIHMLHVPTVNANATGITLAALEETV